jgi:hypothetical protein
MKIPHGLRFFQIVSLNEAPWLSEFRYKLKWYEKLAPSLAQTSNRNKTNDFEWLKIDNHNKNDKVAMLRKPKIKIIKQKLK